MKKIAVVLFNLGGPDSLEAVEPFLFNLFCDPDIFKIPVGQKFIAKLISRRHTPIVKNEYKLIGGKSPINEWTELQRSMLQRELRKEIENADVYTAMRYWNPLTKDVIPQIEKGNYYKIILLPLYPHYSISTTGSSFNEWKRNYTEDKSKLVYINSYFGNSNYIYSINERIDETIAKFPAGVKDKITLVFSAHGVPVSMVKKGDPYNRHIQETVDLVMKSRNHSHEHYLCYQSKVGPVKWLEPSTDSMIRQLASKNRNNLLIIPISFVSDHVETLFELNIEYRHVAEEVKIDNYIVMSGLNDSAAFISALKEETLKALNNI